MRRMVDKRQRLLKALSGGCSKELPVICPGGMMSMVCREASEKATFNWFEAHTRPDVMARVASELSEATGFENLGVPFCVTVEAEAMGGKMDFGNSQVEPRIVDYVLSSHSDITKLGSGRPLTRGRIPVVLEAIAILKAKNADTPIVGNLTGPLSLATSLMDPNLFFRYMVKDKPFIRELMVYVTEEIASFGESQAKAGADVISIGDPTASGEIVGPELFEEFVSPSLREIIGRIKAKQAKTILHICGNTTSILGLLRPLGADALSFDASMSIHEVRNKVGDWVVMGNVSTFLLAEGPVAAISSTTRRVIEDGIDIVSPACGLGTGTMVAYIRAMTDTVRRVRMNGQNISI
jgi:MtaA/CmuA family methyltransferase